MGDTAMRLGRVRLRSSRGAKSWFVGWVTEDWMWLEEICRGASISFIVRWPAGRNRRVESGVLFS